MSILENSTRKDIQFSYSNGKDLRQVLSDSAERMSECLNHIKRLNEESKKDLEYLLFTIERCFDILPKELTQGKYRGLLEFYSNVSDITFPSDINLGKMISEWKITDYKFPNMDYSKDEHTISCIAPLLSIIWNYCKKNLPTNDDIDEFL